jgi:hypothetical protein
LEERNLLSFAPFQPLPITSAALATGDFNGDGKLDIVGADTSGNTVSVLLNKGGGTFQPPVSYAAGTNPTSVAAADFNGDGKLDLAVANAGGVSILLGNGDGTFQGPVNYAAGDSPDWVVAGDFNGDGRPDLAVANRDGGNVSILLNRGNGTFKPAVNILTGGVPLGLAVGDFNGDGKPDLVVADYNGGGPGKVEVLLGKGDGTFQAPVSYGTSSGGAQAVAVGDFNGDGKPDLAVVDNDFTLNVLLNRGDGIFTSGNSYLGAQDTVAAADLNNDGKLDLISVSESGNRVNVFQGIGDGRFLPPVGIAAGGTPVGVVTGDFNSDHLPDLAVVNQGIGLGDSLLLNVPLATQLNVAVPATVSSGSAFSITVTAQDNFGNVATGYTGTITLTASDHAAVLPNTYTFTAADKGTHTFTGAAILWATGPQTILVADTANPALTLTSNVTVNPATTTGPSLPDFVAPAAYPTVVGLRPVGMVAGDFNRDGKLDLVTANLGNGAPGTGSLSVLLGRGDGTFQAASTFGVGPASSPIAVAAGDFNGDGKLDLAVANFGDGSIYLFMGRGDGTFAPGGVINLGFLPVGLAAADLNGDGKLDLVVTNVGSPPGSGPGSVDVLLGNGNGTFQPPQAYAVGTEPVAVAVGDFNGDGKPDLAVVNQGSNTVSLLLGAGKGLFKPAVNYAVGTGPDALALADLNGDGKLDLVTSNGTGSTLSVLLGNGNGTFQTAVNYAVGEDPEAVAVADVNGDGKKDLVVTANYDMPTGTVSILSGNGKGTFNQPVDYAVGAGPVPVVVGDFNGDGLPDLAVGDAGQTRAPAAGVSVFLSQGAMQLQFSAATYRVKETAGLARVTVTRTGNLGGTVTVHYATGNGTAVAGVNYTAVSGTLTFKSGETAKTFTIPVANLNAIEGDVTLKLGLRSPTGGASLAGGTSQAVLTIQDTDGNLTQRFIAQAYLDLLQRPVDPVSLAGWTSALTHGISRVQMAQFIEGSAEYRNLEVQAMYQTYLGRPADPVGLKGFAAMLGSGSTVEQVVDLIVSSPEYYARAGGTNVGFLTALYRDLFGRALDPGAAAGWSAVLAAGVSRAGVANFLINSPEGRQARVRGFYEHFLGREPDARGLNSLTSALQRGTTDQQAVALLIGSDEFLANL